MFLFLLDLTAGGLGHLDGIVGVDDAELVIEHLIDIATIGTGDMGSVAIDSGDALASH